MTTLLRAGLYNHSIFRLSASCEKKWFDFCLNYFCKSCLFLIKPLYSTQSCFSLPDESFCCLFMALAVTLFFHMITDKDLKWKGLCSEARIFLEVKVPSIWFSPCYVFSLVCSSCNQKGQRQSICRTLWDSRSNLGFLERKKKQNSLWLNT